MEARQTHVGADKPLYYEENKHDPRFAQFSEKIIHIVADLPYLAGNVDTSRDDQWTNERFQRNCIGRGIEKIATQLDDGDAIIIADLDEIPDPTTINEIKIHHDSLPLGIYRLEQDFYYYNLNSRRNEKWYHCKMLTFQKYKELNISCDAIRFFGCDSIPRGGWHMSYFGDSQFIKNKLENFAHQEYNSEQYTDTREIQKRMEGCVDLFNRGTCINDMQRVAICHNDYLPPGYKTHLTAFYTPDAEPVRDPRQRYVRTKRGHGGLVIGFHSNQLCERGTEVALFDYAFYNQTLYGNKSIIFYNKNNPNNNARVIARFESHFKCYAYNEYAEIDGVLLSEGADYFYIIGQGIDMQLVSACPNCLHDVFQMQPHGERYATVSRYLALSFNRPDVPFVPHIVHFRSECSDNLREMLGIPADAFVFGRYGGFNQFDISYVHDAICEFIRTNATTYFIFANTRAFCDAHAQILHVDVLYDEADKLKFINTCDAMLHARSDGETFGLSIAEFSIKNKPVVTTHSSIPNSDAHIDMLGERAIIYRNKPELIAIFQNIKQIAASRDDWNAYADYNPESVMRQFMEVFINA